MPRNVCSIFKMRQGAGPEPGNTGHGLSSVSLSSVFWTVWTRMLLFWLFFCWIRFLGFFANLKQEGPSLPGTSQNFPSLPGTSLPIAWRLYQESSRQLFGFLFPWTVFGLSYFSFWPGWGASRTTLNPKAQGSWTKMRKDVKIHQLWPLQGGDPCQKFNSFPICSVLGCCVISSSPFQRQKGPTAILLRGMPSASVFFSLGIFLSFFC